MDSVLEATNPATAAATASDKGHATGNQRVWVGGRLVTGDAEVSAALERVRVLAQARAEIVSAKAGINGASKRHVQEPTQTVDATEPAIHFEALARVAAKLFAQLRVKEAIEIYHSILGAESMRAEANAGLGWCHLYLRDFDKSVHYFEAALDARADFGRALYGVGLSLLELGRLGEAASYARRLAGLAGSEERARGLYVLGLVDRARGAWDDAVIHLEESLQTHPHKRGERPTANEIRHRYELALCYRELNRPDRALDHLRWAAKHERKPGPIVLDLAKLYLELRRAEGAMNHG